ncbi:methyl-accepting chemotaxis protein [Pseudomonas sp. HR96]|uniref:methyl-accepting chemotaxis protein n=1 Tax=Pseudomonas sp. HR96 TaxID=1027966 RepID=UPI002A7545B4|nr:methyl-accepting chemotaxis protein [Pseudomonas sp. HR96]WPO97722.1 methyl-accepting chemotaxis protein [Pseudomonas sp. HR96]
MLTHLKVRTGMLCVLVVFGLSLLAASLTGWYGARASDAQIKSLNLLTAVQLDKLNNAAIWTTRASASAHSAMLARLSGNIEVSNQTAVAATERLNNGQKLIDEILPTVTDPQLLASARDVQAAFNAYRQIVAQQIDSSKGELAAYMAIDASAKNASTAYAKAREIFTGQINASVQATMAASESRLQYAQNTAIALILLTLVLAIACWSFISRGVLAPLRAAGEHFDVMAKGDLSRPVVARSSNEIGQLFRSLAHMQASQRDTLQHVGQTAALLNASATELDAVTLRTTDGLMQQNNELDQAATAVTEMTAAVEEVARNAVSTSEAASASNQLAHASRDQVRKVLSEIGVMSNDVQTTGEVIQRLAAQANDIGKVLDVIRSVSEQTNLLALNAAIEAARAGEAGRGFAVVADEVRTLAQRTQQSTHEIEQMISDIQSSTGAAVGSIELNNQRARSTLEATQVSGQMLEDIFTRINEINERNLVIASAAEEQAQVAREVDRNLSNIRQLSDQSGASATQTRAASGELARLAQQMDDLVRRFKVGV